MSPLMSLFVPILVGGALGTAATLGLVQSSNSAPDKNPASSQIITYGE